jgi:hypothetical protein
MQNAGHRIGNNKKRVGNASDHQKCGKIINKLKIKLEFENHNGKQNSNTKLCTTIDKTIDEQKTQINIKRKAKIENKTIYKVKKR